MRQSEIYIYIYIYIIKRILSPEQYCWNNSTNYFLSLGQKHANWPNTLSKEVCWKEVEVYRGFCAAWCCEILNVLELSKCVLSQSKIGILTKSKSQSTGNDMIAQSERTKASIYIQVLSFTNVLGQSKMRISTKSKSQSIGKDNIIRICIPNFIELAQLVTE